MKGLTLAVKEPIGVIASILDDNQPLLSLSTIMSSIFSTGNTNIIIPSEKTSLIATSMYQVFDTSDVPPGYINILTTKQNELNKIVSQHENIDAIWLFSENSKMRSAAIKETSHNLKRFWCPKNKKIDWASNSDEFLSEFLYQSTQVKNIWIPYGE